MCCFFELADAVSRPPRQSRRSPHDSPRPRKVGQSSQESLIIVNEVGMFAALYLVAWQISRRVRSLTDTCHLLDILRRLPGSRRTMASTSATQLQMPQTTRSHTSPCPQRVNRRFHIPRSREGGARIKSLHWLVLREGPLASPKSQNRPHTRVLTLYSRLQGVASSLPGRRAQARRVVLRPTDGEETGSRAEVCG